MPDGRTRRLLVAVSLANLSLLRVLSELLTFTASDTYLMKTPPSPAQFAGAIGALAVLTALYVLLLELTVRTRFGVLLLAAALVLPVNALREVLSHSFPLLRGPLLRVVQPQILLAAAVLCAICATFVVVRFHSRVLAAVSTVALVLSPFAAITVGRTVWSAVRYDDSRFRDKPAAAPLSGSADPRVVWIIFDEMDQHIAFERADVNLPEFDRFRQSALYATQAFPPSSATLTSIPSLLTGKLVKAARQAGADDLRLQFADGKAAADWVRWDQQENILSFAQQMGFNTALAGWFHPYCRVLNSDTTSCWWEAMPFQADSVSRRFPDSVGDYLRSLFETSLLSPFGQSLAVREGANRLQSLLSVGCKAAADDSYGLVFLHLQAPHAPHAYSRRTGRFTLQNAPVSGYIDSLALADEAFAMIRRAMEQSGVWDKSAVIISSDHWYRSSRMLTGEVSSGRVPFLLKLPGNASNGVVYPHEFRTVHSADLVKAILRGEVRKLDAAVEWLDRIRSR